MDVHNRKARVLFSKYKQQFSIVDSGQLDHTVFYPPLSNCPENRGPVCMTQIYCALFEVNRFKGWLCWKLLSKDKMNPEHLSIDPSDRLHM